ASAAAVTNVAEDHMGEFGVSDLDELADVKLVVTRAAAHGTAVLNADDGQLTAALRRRAEVGAAPLQITWCTLRPDEPEIQSHLAAGGRVCTVDGAELVILEGSGRTLVASLGDIPVCLDGAARHNVYNAMTATGLATAVGISAKDIARGLAAIGGDAADNRGRGNFFRFGATTVLVDFAHNPHGLQALGHMVDQLPHARLLLSIGQAGDRDDQAIRTLARTALGMNPDHILIKGMEPYLRGREAGEVPRLLVDELERGGAMSDLWEYAGSETEAARMALAWAEDGDMLVLTVQSDQEGILQMMTELSEGGWRAGCDL
ncbi:MAG: cyanophycin synthetase, partial [Gemmatimonadota bacterium]